MTKNDLDKLIEMEEIFEQAEDEAEKLADLVWKIENPKATRTPYWETPTFGDGGFSVGGEISYCGCCSGDHESVFIPLRWLSDDSTWEAEARNKLVKRQAEETERKRIDAINSKAAATKRREEEYRKLQQEFG